MSKIDGASPAGNAAANAANLANQNAAQTANGNNPAGIQAGTNGPPPPAAKFSAADIAILSSQTFKDQKAAAAAALQGVQPNPSRTADDVPAPRTFDVARFSTFSDSSRASTVVEDFDYLEAFNLDVPTNTVLDGLNEQETHNLVYSRVDVARLPISDDEDGHTGLPPSSSAEARQLENDVQIEQKEAYDRKREEARNSQPSKFSQFLNWLKFWN